MLPTLIFILWAYGMYALISALSGRRGGTLRPHTSWRRLGWLGVLGGALVGLGLAVVLAQSFDDRDHDLKLTGFLGTVWAEGWPDKMEGRVEYPPMKSPAPGNQPTYALLHPDASPSELMQERTAPKPRPARKPKARKARPAVAKGHKAAVRVAKKDKGAVKRKVKPSNKKKASMASTRKKATPG